MKQFVKTVIVPSVIGSLIAVLVYTVITGQHQPTYASDGYIFGSKQYELNNVRVEVKTYQSYTALQRAAIKSDSSIQNPEMVAAFSVIYPPSNKCTIHMMDPTIAY